MITSTLPLNNNQAGGPGGAGIATGLCPGGTTTTTAAAGGGNIQSQSSYYCQHHYTTVPVININRSNVVFYRFVCNLALADLLVVLFCLPPTLIGNIYLRKSHYSDHHKTISLLFFSFIILILP